MPVVTCCVNFCAVGIPLIVSSFVMVFAFVLHLCGAVSPAWFDFTYTGTSAGTSGYQGLWGHCTIANDNVCCGTVSNYYSTNGGVPEWLTASQYMVAISLCSGVASVVLVFVASCCASKTIAIPAVVCSILTTLLLGAAVITFGSSVSSESWTSRSDYNFAFFFVLFSMIGYTGCAVLIIVGICTATAITAVVPGPL
ncbi:uncharacterized protein LOC110459965 [Mizuhopecten yessoensis]|uniref:uncharacterized protein LOC110459965 n=1 Tax=Mizuhopecten yessoensis TaxID=6573 RepID=UPI000B45902D|nr:uncharacterized protein LOC110459965 [Mizuhopecten yessoensis]